MCHVQSWDGLLNVKIGKILSKSTEVQYFAIGSVKFDFHHPMHKTLKHLQLMHFEWNLTNFSCEMMTWQSHGKLEAKSLAPGHHIGVSPENRSDSGRIALLEN